MPVGCWRTSRAVVARVPTDGRDGVDGHGSASGLDPCRRPRGRGAGRVQGPGNLSGPGRPFWRDRCQPCRRMPERAARSSELLDRVRHRPRPWLARLCRGCFVHARCSASCKSCCGNGSESETWSRYWRPWRCTRRSKTKDIDLDRSSPATANLRSTPWGGRTWLRVVIVSRPLDRALKRGRVEESRPRCLATTRFGALFEAVAFFVQHTGRQRIHGHPHDGRRPAGPQGSDASRPAAALVNSARDR